MDALSVNNDDLEFGLGNQAYDMQPLQCEGREIKKYVIDFDLAWRWRLGWDGMDT